MGDFEAHIGKILTIILEENERDCMERRTDLESVSGGIFTGSVKLWVLLPD
jgi:hypothetical protein